MPSVNLCQSNQTAFAPAYLYESSRQKKMGMLEL